MTSSPLTTASHPCPTPQISPWAHLRHLQSLKQEISISIKSLSFYNSKRLTVLDNLPISSLKCQPCPLVWLTLAQYQPLLHLQLPLLPTPLDLQSLSLPRVCQDQLCLLYQPLCTPYPLHLSRHQVLQMLPRPSTLTSALGWVTATTWATSHSPWSSSGATWESPWRQTGCCSRGSAMCRLSTPSLA